MITMLLQHCIVIVQSSLYSHHCTVIIVQSSLYSHHCSVMNMVVLSIQIFPVPTTMNKLVASSLLKNIVCPTMLFTTMLFQQLWNNVWDFSRVYTCSGQTNMAAIDFNFRIKPEIHWSRQIKERVIFKKRIHLKTVFGFHCHGDEWALYWVTARSFNLSYQFPISVRIGNFVP